MAGRGANGATAAPRASPGRVGPGKGSRGSVSLPELAVALAIAALATGIGVPLVSDMVRAFRLAGATRDLAAELHRTRAIALALGSYAGLRFERSAVADRWRLHLDGGERGIRSAEIASGVDAPVGGPVVLAARYSGVRFGLPSSGPVPRIPPASGTLPPGADPIALGGTDIFSAAPTGETSGGTLYLTDGRDLRAVVVYGPTGRIRVWRLDPGSMVWRR